MAKGKHRPAPGAIRKDRVVHPNSRKANKMAKREQRKKKMLVLKGAGGVRLQALGEKLSWFRDNLCLVLDDEDHTVFPTPAHIIELTEAFLSRFEEELEQIKLKNSLGGKRTLHLARTDLVDLTMKTEREEWEGCGIEMPDYLDKENFQYFKEWSGELRLVQNIKLKRFSKKDLLEKEETMETT